VVPRTQIAADTQVHPEVSERYGFTISNIFHAGDGQPASADSVRSSLEGELDRVKQASDEILDHCIAVGGSITGEHGVGMEKMEIDGPPVSHRIHWR